jgi:hypothetical protein
MPDEFLVTFVTPALVNNFLASTILTRQPASCLARLSAISSQTSITPVSCFIELTSPMDALSKYQTSGYIRMQRGIEPDACETSIAFIRP